MLTMLTATNLWPGREEVRGDTRRREERRGEET